MNARRFQFVLALISPFFLLAFAPAGDTKGHLVIRVIDGDTIAVSVSGKEAKVRLIGVDTPETVQLSKPVERFGKEASAFTKKLLEGEFVRLEYDQQKTDRYGRTLAYVYCVKDGLFVNQEIIQQGFGHAYLNYSFAQEKMDAFRAAEQEAREAKRGLWGDAKKAKAEGKDPPGGTPGSPRAATCCWRSATPAAA